MRYLTIVMFLLVSTIAPGQSPASTTAKIYAVVFQVTVNSSGKVDTLRVAKVLDPSSGDTHSVDVTIPQSYVAAARAVLLKRTYATEPKQFFTYTFYDPSQPSRADIDPRTGHP